MSTPAPTDAPEPTPTADATEAVVVRGVERVFRGAKGASVTALTGIELTVHAKKDLSRRQLLAIANGVRQP